MPKLHLIYSQQKTDFAEGYAYSNPRFFVSPRLDVERVSIVGDWPKVAQAYEALGVPVTRLDKPIKAEATAAPPPKPHTPDPGGVAIPENWRDLPWSKPGEDGLTLRGLASNFGTVKNGDEARSAIEAELKRRQGGDVGPLDIPQPEALGLTLRELHADLEALGVGWGAEDDNDPAKMLRMRDEARALAEAG